MVKKIPSQFQTEFLNEQTLLIRSRVRLFCVMAIGIYLFATALGFLIAPRDFKLQEIPVATVLLAGGFLLLHFNERIVSLRVTKLNAYLFTALLLLVLTKINILYYEGSQAVAAIYVFTLILVSLTIPWKPQETVIITAMGIIAYSFFFLYIRQGVAPGENLHFKFEHYLEGLIFIFTAFAMCLVIRTKETERDIENFALLKETQNQKAQMEKELDLATKVHKTLIPKSIISPLADVAVVYLPAYYLSGDYARFHFVGEDKLIFIICDVTGHGVSAALLVNRLHTEFERLAKENKSPGVLLKELNGFIVDDFEGIHMYTTAFCGLLDFKDMKFTYSNHGHPPQYLYCIRESKVLDLRPQAALLGLPFPDDDIHQSEVLFDHEDKILLFTDGVTEAKSRRGEEYGRERLQSFIANNYPLPADPFNQKLIKELGVFSSSKFRDDIFVLTIDIK